MALSKYHKIYIEKSDEEIKWRADAKEDELVKIFSKIPLGTLSNDIRIAVLGCGDRRFITEHKRIFKHVLKRDVEVITFDITVNHLKGSLNVLKHDCTLPIPNPPYDITYGHVLLKFVEVKKQFDLIINSYNALKPGGVAIHVIDNEEIKAESPKLLGGLWAVPLDKYRKRLNEMGICFKEVPVRYGLAVVLIHN